MECWFCKLQKNVGKEGERWRKEFLSLLGVTVGFKIKYGQKSDADVYADIAKAVKKFSLTIPCTIGQSAVTV